MSSAFPHKYDGSCYGMTLRDYFAAKAMIALVAEPRWDEDESVAAVVGILKTVYSDADIRAMTTQKRYAYASYLMADALLQVRKQE
jgi:hypothetical protein